MKAPLSRVTEYTYALMRIVAGGMFSLHGLQKLFGLFGGTAQPIASQAGAAGIIEVVCGILIMIGFFSGVAAFVASGLMAFAYFIAHAPRGYNPLENRGELAALYAFVFLYIASRGSGRLSLR